MFGNIHLLKTYALCKLNYVFASLVVQKWVISEIQKYVLNLYEMGKIELRD